MEIEDILVKAEPFLCVPAILETALKYFGYEEYKQEDIASHFVVHVPSGSNTNFCNQAIDENPSNWGIKLESSSINELFRDLGLPIKEDYVPIQIFMDEVDFQDRLSLMLQDKHIIICGYNHSALYATNDQEYHHVSIIVASNDTTGTVLLADPGPKGYGLKEVRAEDLFFAIKRASDGIWDISKI